MSLYSRLSPFTSPPKTNQRISRVILTPKTPTISFPPKPTNLLTITAIHGKPRWENLLYTAKPRTLPIIRAVNGNSEHSPVTPAKPSWENFSATAASLYPPYVIVGWFVACVKPSTFAWFVSRGPASYSLTLGLIMLAMGLTLEFKDMIRLFLQRPLSILLNFLYLIGKFFVGVSMVTSSSLAISYPTLAAAPHMFANAYKNVLAVAVATEYSFPQAEGVKEYLKGPSKFVA